MRIWAIAAAAALSAMAASGAEKPVPVGAFRAIEASAGMSVTIEPGAPSATLSGDPRYFDRVIVEMSGDTLRISRKSWSNWGSSWRDQVHVRVTGPADLARIVASSGADVTALSIAARDLDVRASSGAELRVAGSCANLQAEASSGADLDARQLKCQTVEARASSGADLDVFAETTARASASSGADATVHGPGVLTERSSNSGGSARKAS